MPGRRQRRGRRRRSAEEIRDKGGVATHVKLDVTSEEDAAAAVAHTVEQFGSINVLLNNAGINKPLFFLDITRENWQRIMDVNAWGTLNCMQAAARQMKEQGKQDYPYKIINVGSILSREVFDDVLVYSASKHAVLAMIKGGAKALIEHNITVNGYGPGVVRTELWEQLDKDLVAIGKFDKPGESMDSLAENMILMKRYSYPRGRRRHRVVPGQRGQRLHDRPAADDRRRHGHPVTVHAACPASACRCCSTGLLIGGEWVGHRPASSTSTTRPPGELLVEVADASVAEALQAVDAAHARSGPWAAAAPRARAEILRRAFEIMTDELEECARLIVLENGKAWSDAMGGGDATRPSSSAGSARRPAGSPATSAGPRPATRRSSSTTGRWGSPT